jgi:hypothetical protein
VEGPRDYKVNFLINLQKYSMDFRQQQTLTTTTSQIQDRNIQPVVAQVSSGYFPRTLAVSSDIISGARHIDLRLVGHCCAVLEISSTMMHMTFGISSAAIPMGYVPRLPEARGPIRQLSGSK